MPTSPTRDLPFSRGKIRLSDFAGVTPSLSREHVNSTTPRTKAVLTGSSLAPDVFLKLREFQRRHAHHVTDPGWPQITIRTTALEKASKKIPCSCETAHPPGINIMVHGSKPESGSGSLIRGCVKYAAAEIGALRETTLGISTNMPVGAMCAVRVIAGGAHVFNLPVFFARCGCEPPFSKRTLARALRLPMSELLQTILETNRARFAAYEASLTPEQRSAVAELLRKLSVNMESKRIMVVKVAWAEYFRVRILFPALCQPR